jgi:hypothetical protein
MWIRFRNKERIKEILKRDYENSYQTVGLLIVWKPIGIIFLMLIACMIIAIIIGSIKFGIRN